MKADRFKIVALCLSLALILMTGSAMAGTTGPFTTIKYAKEVGAASINYDLPNGTITHVMNYLPVTPQAIIVKAQLQSTPSGIAWTTTNATYNSAMLTMTQTGGGPAATCVYNSQFGNSSTTSTLQFTCTIATPFTSAPLITLDYSTAAFRDIPNIIGNAGTFNISITTYDSIYGTPIDASAGDAVPFVQGVQAVTVAGITTGSKVIDVTQNRTRFTTAPVLADNTSAIGVLVDSTLMKKDSTPFTLTNGLSSVSLFITPSGLGSDWSGVTQIVYDPAGANIIIAAPTGGFTGTVEIPVSGGIIAGTAGALKTVQIDVDGTTSLANRDFQVRVVLQIGGGFDGFPQTTTIQNNTLLTSWTSNGTILFVPWMNGNASAFNGRMYIINPSAQSGTIVAQIFTLPTMGNATTLVGTVTVGTIAPGSAVNVRMNEDVLVPLGIAQPYTANGGNVYVVFSIDAAGCFGTSNVFSGAFSYGMLPMIVR